MDFMVVCIPSGVLEPSWPTKVEMLPLPSGIRKLSDLPLCPTLVIRPCCYCDFWGAASDSTPVRPHRTSITFFASTPEAVSKRYI